MDPTGDPLAALRDVHLPLPPPGLSAWPIIAMAAALLLLLALTGLLIVRLRRRWATDLVAQLDCIDESNAEHALARAAHLLRRVGVLMLGERANRLGGEEWLRELDRLFRTRFFSTGRGRAFGDALYQSPSATGDAGPVLAELRGLARRRVWSPW